MKRFKLRRFLGLKPSKWLQWSCHSETLTEEMPRYARHDGECHPERSEGSPPYIEEVYWPSSNSTQKILSLFLGNGGDPSLRSGRPNYGRLGRGKRPLPIGCHPERSEGSPPLNWAGSVLLPLLRALPKVLFISHKRHSIALCDKLDLKVKIYTMYSSEVLKGL